MLLMKPNRRSAWLAPTAAALAALVVASSAAQAGTVAFVELVPLLTAGPGETTTVLPTPLVSVDSGVPFVVEVWARTDDSQGLASVSTTIQFDQAIASVSGVTHTLLFSELLAGDVDNVAGLVTGLSGSHLSPCTDQVGVTPTWARVAILDMQTTGSGLLAVTSSDAGVLGLGTAICGVGDLLPAQVAYGATTVTVIAGPAPIPTVSSWGLLIMILLLLTVATVVMMRSTAGSPAIDAANG